MSKQLVTSLLKLGLVMTSEAVTKSRNKREGKFHGKHGTRINRDHFKTTKKIHSASWFNANRTQKKLVEIFNKDYFEECDPEFEFC